MLLLILGLMIFIGTHSIRIYAETWREVQIKRLGLNVWQGLFGLSSIVGLVLIVIGFGQARAEPVYLWYPPTMLRHLAGLIIIVSFVMAAAAYVPGNRIKARIGHPLLAGVKGWAFAHLLSTGTLADMILFGAFLSWAELAFQASRRRDRVAGTVYPDGSLDRDLIAIAAGLLAWAVFAFWLHGWLFNVRPFG